MKKVFVGLGLAAVLFAAVPRQAAALSTIGGGLQPFEIGISTPANTAVLISSGAGQFLSADISTAAAGDYCSFYDNNTPSSIVLTGDGTATAPMLLTLAVAATNTTVPSPAGAATTFKNGLVAICNANRRVQGRVVQ